MVGLPIRTDTRVHAHDMHIRVLHRQDLEDLEHGQLASIVRGAVRGEGDLNRARVDADNCCAGFAGREEGSGQVEAAFDVNLRYGQ